MIKCRKQYKGITIYNTHRFNCIALQNIANRGYRFKSTQDQP